MHCGTTSVSSRDPFSLSPFFGQYSAQDFLQVALLFGYPLNLDVHDGLYLFNLYLCACATSQLYATKPAMGFSRALKLQTPCSFPNAPVFLGVFRSELPFSGVCVYKYL
jgi:hypothetical protein